MHENIFRLFDWRLRRRKTSVTDTFRKATCHFERSRALRFHIVKLALSAGIVFGITIHPNSAYSSSTAQPVSEASIAQLPAGTTLRLRTSKTALHALVQSHDGDASVFKKLAEQAAIAHALPVDYFLRLISQESGFNPNSVSPAGAQGIAQFMPATATDRGLKDPFDPTEALPKSAELLNEFKMHFGNLGLAAAAYNAGPERVRRWLAGESRLPQETLNYVWIVTGREAAEWAAPNAGALSVISAAPRIRFRTPRRDWEAELLATMQSASSKGVVPVSTSAGAAKEKNALCPSCIVRQFY
jgi:hypothetical protein